MIFIALSIMAAFSSSCNDVTMQPWNYHTFSKFVSANSIDSNTSEIERSKKNKNFLIAIDSCGMADWITKHQSENNYIEWLPLEVICKRWHLLHKTAIKNTRLWKECILKSHRCEILEYARSDCDISKDTALLYQLQDLILIGNIKDDLKRNCDTGYIDVQDRITASDYVRLIMEFADSSDKIRILSIMSLSKKIERSRYTDLPLGQYFAMKLARFINDKKGFDTIKEIGSQRIRIWRNIGKRDSCNKVMQNYCIKYAVSKSGLTEKELLDYLVAKNTFIPIKNELQMNNPEASFGVSNIQQHLLGSSDF